MVILGLISRIGNCPSINLNKNLKCTIECSNDYDCPWSEKCCDNSCGRVCIAPENATGHFIYLFNFIFFNCYALNNLFQYIFLYDCLKIFNYFNC